MDLLIATKNKNKLLEITDLLADLPFQLQGLDQFPDVREVEETGATFSENAYLKACAYAVGTGLWTLADDSGLEVEALGGAPGVFSARYADGKPYSEKIAKLLLEISKARIEERTARFVCAMAVSDETGRIMFQAKGVCAGTIAFAPSGQGGFGYDPIFVPDGFDQTFGELPRGIKRKISHRSVAIAEIFSFLRDFIA